MRGLLGDLHQVLLDLLLVRPPREVGVGLVETDRAEGAHHRGAREGLGQKERARVLRLDVGEQTLPEGNRLRVRVVDTENRHAVVDPQFDDVTHRLVDALRVVVEVQRIDVLILLRGVLRVRDRAIGARREPLGVLGDPRVVGGALEGQVERHLHAQASGAFDETVEVIEGTQIRVDGVVPSLGRADPIGGTWVTGGCDQGVVLALTERRANRVDRRQVDNVEAHVGDAWQVLGGIRKRAGHPGAVGVLVGTRRARENLVPCAGEGLGAGHVERVDAGGIKQIAQRVVAENQADARRDTGGQALLGGMRAVAQATCGVMQGLDVSIRRGTLARVVEGLAGGRTLHEARALLQHQLDVDTGTDLDGCVVTPGGVGVRPGIHAERPCAGSVGGHPGLVTVQAGGNIDHAGTGVFTSVRA